MSGIAARRSVALLLCGLVLAACGGSGPSSDAGESAPPAAGSSAEPATEAWDQALVRHAVDGGLDYAGLAADRGDLDRFLESLAEVDPQALPEGERLAFWMNAYNAVVAHFVLERYPGIESVEDVDGFFDTFTYPVAGRDMTLDAIEAEARKLDPRSHFAVVCASTSCPDLLGEAYTGEQVDPQLEEQTRSFLADPDKGLRYDAEANELWLSSIFKWYAGDFTGGSTVVAFFARGGVADWVRQHASEEIARAIEEREPQVRYLDYDWSLNDRPRNQP